MSLGTATHHGRGGGEGVVWPAATCGPGNYRARQRGYALLPFSLSSPLLLPYLPSFYRFPISPPLLPPLLRASAPTLLARGGRGMLAVADRDAATLE